MDKQYIQFDISDERAGLIAEVLANKTCKKILSLLNEKEMSESDLANSLELPLNTVHYNVQKLVDSGLVETANKFFWSSKGKRMVIYKLSNKKVVISPKTSFKGILPAFIATGIVAVGISIFGASQKVSYSGSQAAQDTYLRAAEQTASLAEYGVEKAATMPGVSDAIVTSGSTISSIAPWSWFLLGAWAALLIFVLFNMRRSSLN